MRFFILLNCFVLAVPTGIAAAEVELSVPVRVLGAAPAAESANMRTRPAPADPQSVTSGLLPQYQSARAFQSNVPEAPTPAKAALRFLLALPDQPLLIEARVTINGQPFEMAREQRIDRLIADLSKPAQADPEPSPQTSPAVGAADVPAAEQVVPEVEPAADESKDKEAEAEPAVQLISVPSSDLEARLRRYATVTGRPPTREELRWLLTKWMDGPTLLLLDENFQRFRGAQMPAFHVLDRDLDGKISAEELSLAQQTLLSCDVNQNDVVEYAEILEVADDPRRKGNVAPMPVPVLIPILDAESAAKSFQKVAKRYASSAGLKRFDANSDGALDAGEIAKLAEMDPDVTVAIAFDSSDAAKSTTTVTHISSTLAINKEQIRSIGSSITIPLGGTLLEFSAVQLAALSESDQISVGVVNDGYPLLPAIDPNEDGRMTIRELRSVLDRLRPFDVDGDGEISLAELPATIRVSFGLGPCVHQHLADIRTVHPPSTAPKVDAPAWFTRMDGNKDGDISPREFLLGAEQFKKLDVDEDGLISIEEATNAALPGAEN